GLPKISGSTSEPYFLAVSLIPAVYIHLNDIFTPSKLLGKDFSWPKSVLTIICFILTGASSGYIAFFIILALLAYNKNLLNMRSLGLVLLPLFMYVVYFIYTVFSTNSKDFSSRVSDTWYVFSSDDEEGVKAGKINGSSFALYSNFKVASNSFIKNPLSGSGLGTHEVNYQQYFYKYFSSKIVKRFVAELNKEDANSTFIRLLSETGLFGLFFFLFFVFRNLSLRKHESHFDSSVRFLLLFNQGIFIMLIIRLMRTGNYIGNGFFFFFFFYWASSLFLGEVLGPRKSAGLGMLSGKNSQPSPNI
ncbi:MAG TPA: O-antigen ligase family protein, partial [Flavitalea sp.]|nr:O-antigen ligase family protein [Flavitalea sp.]